MTRRCLTQRWWNSATTEVNNKLPIQPVFTVKLAEKLYLFVLNCLNFFHVVYHYIQSMPSRENEICFTYFHFLHFVLSSRHEMIFFNKIILFHIIFRWAAAGSDELFNSLTNWELNALSSSFASLYRFLTPPKSSDAEKTLCRCSGDELLWLVWCSSNNSFVRRKIYKIYHPKNKVEKFLNKSERERERERWARCWK